MTVQCKTAATDPVAFTACDGTRRAAAGAGMDAEPVARGFAALVRSYWTVTNRIPVMERRLTALLAEARALEPAIHAAEDRQADLAERVADHRPETPAEAANRARVVADYLHGSGWSEAEWQADRAAALADLCGQPATAQQERAEEERRHEMAARLREAGRRLREAQDREGWW